MLARTVYGTPPAAGTPHRRRSLTTARENGDNPPGVQAYRTSDSTGTNVEDDCDLPVGRHAKAARELVEGRLSVTFANAVEARRANPQDPGRTDNPKVRFRYTVGSGTSTSILRVCQRP